MARILITGSTSGIGLATATKLLDDGHDVVVHARTTQRLDRVRDLIRRGADSVIGDLSDPGQVEDIATQLDSGQGFDAVIHNAGVMDGRALVQVNLLAAYVLTARVPADRLIYLSSSMHRGGRADLTRLDAADAVSYSDSKLFVTTLMAAVARRRPGVIAHAVDPGWVPTRMGGPGANDDLALAHLTQVWLATTDDPAALISGRYWYHQHVEEPHPVTRDPRFQDELLTALERLTGVELPGAEASVA